LRAATEAKNVATDQDVKGNGKAVADYEPSDTPTLYHTAVAGPSRMAARSPSLDFDTVISASSSVSTAATAPAHQQNVKTTPGPPRGVMVPLVLLVHPDPPWSTFSVNF